MMKRLIIGLVLMGLGVGHAEVPKLFTERAFTSASLAEAVNHYVAIGEVATVKELDKFIADDASHANYLFTRGYSVNERVSWVCRILYEPRDYYLVHDPKLGMVKVPDKNFHLRGPQFGLLKIPEKSMPADKWPLYPLVLSGSTYLVLNENYNPNGVPEELKHYMDYCKENGVFRTTPIPVPTREQAFKDAMALRQSRAWQDIQWVDKDGYSYPLGEQWTFGYIVNQAKAIPAGELAQKHPNPDATAVSLR